MSEKKARAPRKPATRKGAIYQRGDSPYWWLAFYNEDGKRRLKSSGTADEKEAKKLLASVERKVAAVREKGLVAVDGNVLVRDYAEVFFKERESQGHVVQNERGRMQHVLPDIGDMPLGAVRYRHIRDLFRKLRATSGLAPRTIRVIYSVVKSMFGTALEDELITATPCTITRRSKVLPPIIDKDPFWRKGAVFQREEVVQLLYSDAIPEDRRVLYALLFLGDFRIGEASALKWKAYDPTLTPLGSITVAYSFSKALKRTKDVKSGRPREMPVHPVLAAILADWKANGWAKQMKRAPESDDLIVVSRWKGNVSHARALENLKVDLKKLGLRRRRVHDARRTFISLAQADGARADILHWVTHGPPGDIMSVYTTMPWETLCAEVAKLRIPFPPRRPADASGISYEAATRARSVRKGEENQLDGGVMNLPWTNVIFEPGSPPGRCRGR